MTTARIEIFPGRRRLRRQWFYRVIAANGEIVAASEAYPTGAHAMRGAQQLRAIFTDTPSLIRIIPAAKP